LELTEQEQNSNLKEVKISKPKEVDKTDYYGSRTRFGGIVHYIKA